MMEVAFFEKMCVHIFWTEIPDFGNDFTIKSRGSANEALEVHRTTTQFRFAEYIARHSVGSLLYYYCVEVIFALF